MGQDAHPKNAGSYFLTHLPLDKMAALLADDNFKCIFLNENDRTPIRISLKFVPRSPIDNEPALVQVMAGLVPNRQQAITWTNADPAHRRIYAVWNCSMTKHIEFLIIYRYFRHKIYDIMEIKRLYKFYTKMAKRPPFGAKPPPPVYCWIITYNDPNSICLI